MLHRLRPSAREPNDTRSASEEKGAERLTPRALQRVVRRRPHRIPLCQSEYSKRARPSRSAFRLLRCERRVHKQREEAERTRVKSSRHRSFPRHDVKDNNVRLGHGGGLPKGSQVLQLRKDGVREARNKVERDENECRFDPNSESMNSLVERQRTRCAHTFSEKPEMLLHDARAEGQQREDRREGDAPENDGQPKVRRT